MAEQFEPFVEIRVVTTKGIVKELYDAVGIRSMLGQSYGLADEFLGRIAKALKDGDREVRLIPKSAYTTGAASDSNTSDGEPEGGTSKTGAITSKTDGQGLATEGETR